MKFQTLKGRVVNLQSNEILAVLQDAGLVLPYEEPAAVKAPCVVTWFVGRATSTGEKNVSAVCSCSQRNAFFGVKAPVTWHGSTSPPGVIAEYRNAS